METVRRRLRVCSKCLKLKDEAADFSPNSPTGQRQTVCKECRAASARAKRNGEYQYD